MHARHPLVVHWNPIRVVIRNCGGVLATTFQEALPASTPLASNVLMLRTITHPWAAGVLSLAGLRLEKDSF